MRLNDRAGETRYIDPVTERSVQADFGYVKLAGIMPGVTQRTVENDLASLRLAVRGRSVTGGFTDSDSWRLGVMAGYAPTTT